MNAWSENEKHAVHTLDGTLRSARQKHVLGCKSAPTYTGKSKLSYYKTVFIWQNVSLITDSRRDLK
jgi:hypothetical protein